MLDVFILAGYKPFGVNQDGFNSRKKNIVSVLSRY